MRLGESDLLLTLFTEKFGKLKVAAKGAVKPKSRIGGRCEPFIHGNAIFFGKEKTDIYRLNGIDVQNPFLKVRSDLSMSIIALAASEFVDLIIMERSRETTIFEELIFLLKNMEEKKSHKNILFYRFFQIKVLHSAGFLPHFSTCVICGKNGLKIAGFNPRRGGAICHICFPSDPSAMPVSFGTVKLLEKSILTSNADLDRLNASRQDIVEMGRIAAGMLFAHLRRECKAERFMEMLV